MNMNAVFVMGMLMCGLWALTHGTAENMGAALMDAGAQAVQLMLTLAGGYMVWCGLMEILSQSGAVRAVSRVMEKPVKRLLGKDAQKAEVRELVCLNLAANLLGLGNAATPAGLSAMQRMAEGTKKGELTRGMRMFALLNACCLQLAPTTVIALRASLGSADPGDIVLPALLGSLSSAATAAGLGLMLERGKA